jgi:hypothetical protein
MDFYHKRVGNFFPSREALLTKYGLSSNYKTITFATSTQDADFDDAVVENMKTKRVRILSETIDYKDIVNNMRKSRRFLTEVIQYVADAYSNVNMVIKPHPNENITYWRKLVDSLSEANIYLCIGEPINHLLKISDLHISLNVCTTTFESLLAGVPVIEIHTDISESLYGEEHLFLAPYTAKTLQEFDAAAQAELFGSGGKFDEQAQGTKLQKYVEKYFYKFDGCRCYEYAKKMDVFIKRTINDPPVSILRYFGSHKSQLVSFLANELSKPLGKLKRATKNIMRAIFSAGNSKIIAKQENSKIDSRGRYDNRIKPGDEEYWFKKFEEARFLVENFEKN